MILSELFEDRQHLPLNKGVIAHAKTMYGAFICVMSPYDFLRLTTGDEDGPERIIANTHDTTLATFAAKQGRMRFDRYNMPFLEVRMSDGQICGHEGRHRAALVHKAGGTKYPCMIYPRDDIHYIVSTSDWDGNQISQTFRNDPEAASEYQDELSRTKADDGYPKYRRVEYDYSGGGKLRGAPARSKPDQWIHAAWKVDDMPKQLIGEFNPNVVVTKFVVAPVKGYHHHKG